MFALRVVVIRRLARLQSSRQEKPKPYCSASSQGIAQVSFQVPPSSLKCKFRHPKKQGTCHLVPSSHPHPQTQIGYVSFSEEESTYS